MIINNLPWTLEAEARLDGHNMYQTCMTSGKTTLAGRWAVSQTLIGRDVVWLVDSMHRISEYAYFIEKACEQKGITQNQVRFNGSDKYIINDKMIKFVRTIGNGRGYRFDSIVIDDAGTMVISDWGRKEFLCHFIETAQNSLVLGTGKLKGLLKQLNDNLDRYKYYHSIDYNRVIKDGILTEDKLQIYKDWFKSSHFDEMMGPWLTGNAAKAHLLSKYDA